MPSSSSPFTSNKIRPSHRPSLSLFHLPSSTIFPPSRNFHFKSSKGCEFKFNFEFLTGIFGRQIPSLLLNTRKLFASSYESRRLEHISLGKIASDWERPEASKKGKSSVN